MSWKTREIEKRLDAFEAWTNDGLRACHAALASLDVKHGVELVKHQKRTDSLEQEIEANRETATCRVRVAQGNIEELRKNLEARIVTEREAQRSRNLDMEKRDTKLKEAGQAVERDVQRLEDEVTLLRATAATLLEVRVDTLQSTAKQLKQVTDSLNDTHKSIKLLTDQRTVRSMKKEFHGN